MCLWVGEQWEYLQHLEKRTGPAMQQQQWHRVGSFASFVNEMDMQSINAGFEVSKAVQGLLLSSPIEFTLPVVDEVFQICQVGAIIPACALNLIGPAGAFQASAYIVERFLLYVHFEWMLLHMFCFFQTPSSQYVWLPSRMPLNWRVCAGIFRTNRTSNMLSDHWIDDSFVVYPVILLTIYS